MYRVLRSSMYADPYDRTPATLVARECDLKKPLEEAAGELERATPGALVVNDIFEVDERTYGDFVRASMAGAKRLADSARLDAELHMAMSFYWNADQLTRLTDGGTLVNPGEAPLNAGQLRVVMRQLGRHPNYRHQTLVFRSINGEVVTFRDGTFA